MIYAVHILDGKFVKVGFTEGALAARIAALQTGCPFEIKDLLSVEGTLIQEKAIHASLRVAFGRVRIPMPPNEWYPGLNPFFQEFLASLKYGANAGLAFSERYNPAVRQPGQMPKASTVPNIKWPKLKGEVG